MSSVSCLSLCLGLNVLDSLQFINVHHQYDVQFVFTCISLLPIVLSMSKECRYSVHPNPNPYFQYRLEYKMFPNKYREEAKMCYCSASICGAIQYVVQFHRTAAGQHLALCSKILSPNGLPSKYNADSTVENNNNFF